MSMDKTEFIARVGSIVAQVISQASLDGDGSLKVRSVGPADLSQQASQLYDDITAQPTTNPSQPAPVEPDKPLPTPGNSQPTEPNDKNVSGTHADRLSVTVSTQDVQQPTKAVVSVKITAKNNADALQNQIIDVEAWSSDGTTKRAQLFEVGNINSEGATEYQATLPVMEAGTYEVRVGLFDAPQPNTYEWGAKRYYAEKAGSIKVTAAPPYVPTEIPNTTELYRAPQSVDSFVAFYPTLDKIASQPVAKWMGEWSGPIEDALTSLVGAAHGKTVLTVAYNIPNRDAGQYSAGGLASYDLYRTWIHDYAKGIGDKPAFTIIEPDAIGHFDLLSPAEQVQRQEAISYAISCLQGDATGVAVMDASMWVDVKEQARRLVACGMKQAKFFVVNVSGYESDSDAQRYADALVAELLNVHGVSGVQYAVDTSRNGNGSIGQWCNPAGRALGKKPGKVQDSQHPAHAWNWWVKAPGESDGTCNGGPAAGQFWPERAVELARNAAY